MLSNKGGCGAGSYDASVRLWDLRSQSFEPIQVLDHSKDSVTSVRIGQFSILVGYIHAMSLGGSPY